MCFIKNSCQNHLFPNFGFKSKRKICRIRCNFTIHTKNRHFYTCTRNNQSVTRSILSTFQKISIYVCPPLKNLFERLCINIIVYACLHAVKLKKRKFMNLPYHDQTHSKPLVGFNVHLTVFFLVHMICLCHPSLISDIYSYKIFRNRLPIEN